MIVILVYRILVLSKVIVIGSQSSRQGALRQVQAFLGFVQIHWFLPLSPSASGAGSGSVLTSALAPSPPLVPSARLALYHVLVNRGVHALVVSKSNLLDRVPRAVSLVSAPTNL